MSGKLPLRTPGWLDEFRTFIMRGNVVDLAVGIIIGAAFTAIVGSLVKDIFNPLIGLLMAPIYPVINSVALSSLPKPLHAAMTGLIVVFSALGGTLGSRITAIVFSRFDGIHAFYFSLVPMALLLATLFLFRREADRATAAGGVGPFASRPA